MTPPVDCGSKLCSDARRLVPGSSSQFTRLRGAPDTDPVAPTGSQHTRTKRIAEAEYKVDVRVLAPIANDTYRIASSGSENRMGCATC